MIEFAKAWLNLKTDQKGVTALEYGLIAGAIAAVMMVGANALFGDLSTQFTTIGSALHS